MSQARLRMGLFSPLLVLGSALLAQEAPPARRELEPWMRGQIVDKRAIAEDVQRQVGGPRENDNPHIIPGSILRRAEVPGPLSDAQLEDLRTKQRQRHSGHDANGGDFSEPRIPTPVHVEEPAREKREASRIPIVIAIITASGALILVLRTRHREGKT